MSYEIKGTIDVTRRSFGGQDHFLLCFTPDRVIAAKAGGSGAGTAVAFGALGTFIREMAAAKKARDLKKLSGESLLKADKTNFELLYSNVTKVQMKKGGVWKAGEIRLETVSGEHKFNPTNRKLFEEHVNLVRGILPDKLEVF